MATGGNAKAYSDAFERLFTNDQDLAGAIAYALYKADKRDYIRNNNLKPGDTKIKNYHQMALGQGNAQALRARADTLIAEYVSSAVAAAEAGAVEQVKPTLEGISVRLEELRNHVSARTKFWWSVAAGVTASVIFALMLSLAVILNKNQQNPFGAIYELLYDGTKAAPDDKKGPAKSSPGSAPSVSPPHSSASPASG